MGLRQTDAGVDNIWPFSPWLCRQRSAAKRFSRKPKRFRSNATRYDKRRDDFLAFRSACLEQDLAED